MSLSKRSPGSVRSAVLRTAAALLLMVSAAGAQNGNTTRQQPLDAVIMLRSGKREVTLLGRQGERVTFRDRSGDTPSLTVSVDAIHGLRFAVPHDKQALSQAVRRRDWDKAGAILWPVVYYALPYVDIAENNMAEKALETGTYFMRAASVKTGARLSNKARARGRDDFAKAQYIFKHLAGAIWFDDAESANLRGIICLAMLDKPGPARAALDQAQQPDTWDRAYGFYWLADGLLRYGQGEYRDALEKSLLSVTFEAKNQDTFPDSLLLSARCYEELLEWHRARDVYYGVATLFSNTHWETFALGRLRDIMAQGVTATGEVARVDAVFFGSDEDINARVTELLESEDKNKE